MIELFTFGECRICETPCIWMPWDGLLLETETCSEECLDKVAEKIQNLPEGGEIELRGKEE